MTFTIFYGGKNLDSQVATCNIGFQHQTWGYAGESYGPIDALKEQEASCLSSAK